MPPKVLRSRRVYEGKVVALRVDTLEDDGGRVHDAEIVEHSEAVVVIVRPKPNEMLLVKQYRHPLGRETWEVVAGGMESGESPEDAAVRELREETGYRAERVTRLFSAFSAPGFCNELLHFCLIDGYTIGEAEPDEGEHGMSVGIFALDDLKVQIYDDQLPDAKTQIAVLWALGERTSS
jgi:ADP-ribose pyrophosphatase